MPWLRERPTGELRAGLIYYRAMDFSMQNLVALFGAPIALVGALAVVHATGYLHGDARRRAPWFWFYLFGTLAAMAAVVFSPGLLTFLLAWEAMGLFSTGLVGFESAEKETRKAVWIYLLACHAGAVCLILAGILSLRPDAPWTAIWYLALAGFGLKIGLPPFHVWLPEAHPAAPAPASAVMSGAMIPLGFYGLIRFFAFGTGSFSVSASLLPHFGWSLLVFGSLAALGGILFALPQRNIKRLLAFSSVENMGIVALGLSLAAWGWQAEREASIAYPALAGALLHVVNHAFLKGGLFLGAGSVLRMTGTLDMDRLGGLMKKMPGTGTLFALNAFGLSGLPPLNAFASEFLIYLAAFQALARGVCILPACLVLVVLALTGGIAAAAYAKTVSAVFLGEARSDLSAVTETPRQMVLAQVVLFALSLATSFGVAGWAQVHLGYPVLVLTILFYGLFAGLLVLRFVLPRGREHPRRPTWDCGYAQPTPRMAWTGTAFAQPLADTFEGVLRPRVHRRRAKGLFPADAAIAVETDDAGVTRFWGPVFHCCARLFQRAHLLQNGSLHFYVLLMILAVVALLVWGGLS